MKMLRKNIDLSSETVAILQIEATLSGFGSLKPFLEKIVNDFATKCSKGRPEVYRKILDRKIAKSLKSGVAKRTRKASR